mgnify:CR=1 FL=1
MKAQLRKIFSFILSPFESGTEPYVYKPLNRKILLFISFLFFGLAMLVLYLIPAGSGFDYALPVIVFTTIAIVGLVIGLLGNDRAIAKIWGTRK